MRPAIKTLGLLLLGAGLITGGCTQKHTDFFTTLKSPEDAAQLKSFIAEKEAQADQAARADGHALAPVFKTFFATAQRGDWLSVSNQFEDFRRHAGQYEHTEKTDERLRGPAWEGMKEIWGAFYFFNVAGEKYTTAFGRDIIESIPPGSIYFGGTDPGRFVVTALCKSHVGGDPFFLITQNALADGSYLAYVRGMYDGEIDTLTDEDSQKCFEDYTADLAQRAKNHQLKPGESLTTDANGRTQISGQVAVMEVNGLLVKRMFDQNPKREFYIEESFPLDWMYPQLEPHGLILKIDRQPAALSDEILQRDRDYWIKYLTPMIGDWLNPDTSLADVTAFAEKVYGKKDLSGFTGDPEFVQNADAQKMFAKLRSAIAGVYAWRAGQAGDEAEKARLSNAADFAFRQALALCPSSPEVVYRYVNLLVGMNRRADARLVAETAAHTAGGDGGQFRALTGNLQR